MAVIPLSGHLKARFRVGLVGDRSRRIRCSKNPTNREPRSFPCIFVMSHLNVFISMGRQCNIPSNPAETALPLTWRDPTMVTRSQLIAVMLCYVPTNAVGDTFGNGDNTFEIEFVTIGDLGNPADPVHGPVAHYPDQSTGSVDYVYRIGKFEVSRDMVTKANAEGNLAITLDPMDFVLGGPRPEMPATGVSWNEAARFVNWLNTSRGFPAAYKFNTQPGNGDYIANEHVRRWQSSDPGFDKANPWRNSEVRYFLPNLDEWHKAAHFDPKVNGGAGGYWRYPTGSDAEPTPVASGTASGTAVYGQTFEQGPADVRQAGGLSPYGVMATGSNVFEYEETEFRASEDSGAPIRGVRGGHWLVAKRYAVMLSAGHRAAIGSARLALALPATFRFNVCFR